MSDDRTVLQVRLPDDLRRELVDNCDGDGIAPDERLRQWIAEFLRRRKDRATATADVEKLRGLVAEGLTAATDWQDMQAALRRGGVEYFEKGGGLALRCAADGAYVCKASAVGPGYSELMKHFGPFPEHSHEWLAKRVLGDGAE